MIDMDGQGTHQRRIDYLPLAAIVGAPRNAKRHNGPGIAASIGKFGVGELPLLDERTGRLVAGHGRVEQLRTMHAAGQTPPDGVTIDDDGEWLIPVTRGWASRSDLEAEAYLVASNQLTTAGGWDDAELADMLADLDAANLLDLTGFTDEDLAGLLGAGGATPTGLTDPDDVPDMPAAPVSVLGDLWLLGPHRVLVGDATNMAAVQAMLDGDRADCMWTDPPYGVDYVGKTKDALTIQNDGATDLPDLLAGAFAVATAALKPGAAVYVCHAPGPLSLDFAQAFIAAGWLWRQNLVWVKDVLVLGRSDYHYRHEPIMYGFTDSGEGRLGRGGDRWHGDNAQTTVFEVAKPIRSSDHPTMKPVDLIAQHLANSCPPGGMVYDPFGGSGSTLIAAHQTRRVARIVELDPKYVDVICRRYQDFTGDMPRRQLADGTTEAVDSVAESANQ